jgi:phosphate transport system permease protein
MQKRIILDSVFKLLGGFSVTVLALFLFILLFSVVEKGIGAFTSHKIKINLINTQNANDAQNLNKILNESFFYTYPSLINSGLVADDIVSNGSKVQLKTYLEQHKYDKNLSHIWLKTSSDIDLYLKGKKKLKNAEVENSINILVSQKSIISGFNYDFFSLSDSQKVENAGILGGLVSSIMVIVIALVIAFLFGLGGAVYFEEFASGYKKNKLVNFINNSSELLIANLAGIPSIIYGLLGLWLFIGVLEMPRSSSIVGGLTLSFMMLPIIIVSTRSSLKTVPKSLKEGAMAMGANKMQVLFHHTIPFAMPGIVTGTLLALARIIGETSPLLVIGMVAFVAEAPSNIFAPSAPLPVQIYLWSDKPEAGFSEKASGAIIVLLVILSLFNYLAYYLRNKFERKL